jgi:DNA mismatch repair protein MutS
MVKLTPGMQQYMEVKNANPDCIILFRMGDFYETFFEDAKTIARELEITLTARGKGETKAPLAGIPYHAIEPYLAKLVKKGYKVGIVEQTEDPKKAKGLVKRELIRIITPGTIIDSSILEKNKNNYVLCIYENEVDYSVTFCDLSTGEFLVSSIEKKNLLDELKRINPSEIIFPSSYNNLKLIHDIKQEGYILSEFEDRFFYYEKAYETLKNHFEVLNLEGFGIRSKSIINCAGALLSYLKETQLNSLTHINKISHYLNNDFMFLDSATIRNLELIHNIIHKNEESTLLSLIDKTTTPMGKRLIKKWLLSPLIIKEKIQKRLDSVEELKEKMILRQDLKENLRKIYDIERLIGRVAYGNANPKDLVAIGNSLKYLPKIKLKLEETKTSLLNELSSIPDLSEPEELIKTAIKDEPPITIREGNIINEGYNQELDQLRELSIDAKTYLAEIEEKEKERTKIKSLKIRYNKIIGYFIEVTKSNLSLVPPEYIRKQTQLNCERFVTEELKDLEEKIIGAQERIYELEFELFNGVLEKLSEYTTKIQECAKNLAVIDCIISLSQIAQEKSYTKPSFNDSNIIELSNSRHPVIEEFSEIDFISNDCKLTEKQRTMIITGPNMAGKSTFLRQVALISLLAQIGSFVPAKYANLIIVDRIFSRIGAYDDLVNKQSTFMVEMNETANILNNATDKSLVIIDEIGRGTSTFDGVSLAWSIAEYLNNNIKCKTLFATHYHHLNNMSSQFEGIKNYNISVEETEDSIIFLRKIIEGGTDKSYGIQVAKLAGLPKEVINKAKEIMKKIELEDEISKKITQEKIPQKRPQKPEDNTQDIKVFYENDIANLDHSERLIDFNETWSPLGFTNSFPKTIECYEIGYENSLYKQTDNDLPKEKSKIEILEEEIERIKNSLNDLKNT